MYTEILPAILGGAAEDAHARDRSVMIVDDHRSFAESLAAALTTVPGFVCVGCAHSATDAVAMAYRLRPELVIMDLQMPQQDGLCATRHVLEVSPDSAVAVVTAHRDAAWISRSALAGASAFIPKDVSLGEMIDVLRRTRSGEMVVAPSTFRSGGEPAPVDDAAPDLTPRERDVLRCLAQGMQPRGIAAVLGISVHTCRGYLKALHVKLGATSQLETVVKAQRLGLVPAAPPS